MNNFGRSSGLDFSDANTSNYHLREEHPDLTESSCNGAAMRRNKTERRRLQGLQKTLPRIRGPAEPKSLKERLNVWLINEGGRKLFFATWILLHLLVAVFGFINYQVKDIYDNARALLGPTFAIARGAALVLHVDVIFILLPVCRNFISLLRRTPLNGIIPFDSNITLHKATAWAIVAGTLVHIAAHMVNFYKLAASMSSTPTELFVNFLSANFATGTGATGWVMTIILGIMTFFCD